MSKKPNWKGWLTPPSVVFLLCVVFIIPGFILIPYFGIQEDEAMFATDLFAPSIAASQILIKPVLAIPTMLMSYVRCRH
jgi:hypothetical protein